MPVCKNCKSTFEGVYRAKYCCVKCRLDFKSVLNADTGCIEWTGGKQTAGYGALNIGGEVLSTHRLSYEVNVGPIPEGMFVCHRCDNPSCVNPEHLFIGTNADNMEDMQAKGRAAWAKKKMPQEVREKIKLAMASKVRTSSEKQRKAASETMSRLWQSPEYRKMRSEATSGANNPCAGPMSEERRAKYQASWAARIGVKRGPMSEETKRKISEANKGKRGNVGRVVSDSTRQKMREAAKAREANKRKDGWA